MKLCTRGQTLTAWITIRMPREPAGPKLYSWRHSHRVCQCAAGTQAVRWSHRACASSEASSHGAQMSRQRSKWQTDPGEGSGLFQTTGRYRGVVRVCVQRVLWIGNSVSRWAFSRLRTAENFLPVHLWANLAFTFHFFQSRFLDRTLRSMHWKSCNFAPWVIFYSYFWDFIIVYFSIAGLETNFSCLKRQ